MSALDEILRQIELPDPYRNPPANLRALQLEAVRDVFAQRRQQIRILDRRATDVGATEIRRLDDLVPLLFSHTSYKSYPESFVDKGQWANMNLWLQTMSTVPVAFDVAGIGDVDDWLGRLQQNGHYVFATSGTSGKSSFLNRTRADLERCIKATAQGYDWPNRVFKPCQDRPVFSFFPPYGSHPMCELMRLNFERMGAPGEVHFMSTEPMRAMQTIRAGHMRRAIAAGTARPDEIVAFEREVAATQARMGEQLQACMDRMFAARRQPMVLSAQWPLLFRIMQQGRARGIQDGEFHPDTVIVSGGGIKGVKLPPDYREQAYAFFGVSRHNYLIPYGMSEMTGVCPYSLDADGFAIPPWIVPLILDKAGEKLLNGPDETGTVEGRMALYDLAVDGRWGGLISGDKVTVDFGPGPDGIRVPRVRSIAHYQDLEEGEDKLTCAGTIDTYVRGTVGA